MIGHQRGWQSVKKNHQTLCARLFALLICSGEVVQQPLWRIQISAIPAVSRPNIVMSSIKMTHSTKGDELKSMDSIFFSLYE